jgi:magnesium transporter
MSDRKQKLGLPAGSLIYIGDKDKLQAHVDVTVFDFNENQLTEFCPTDLNDLIKFKNQETVTWINIDGIHDVEFIKQAGEIFDLHPLLLEDIFESRSSPEN